MRTPGKVSGAKAARILGVDRKTIYEQARRHEQGLPSKLQNVVRHPLTGRLSFDLEEVKRLRDTENESGRAAAEPSYSRARAIAIRVIRMCQ